jgi:hypothetical protein
MTKPETPSERKQRIRGLRAKALNSCKQEKNFKTWLSLAKAVLPQEDLEKQKSLSVRLGNLGRGDNLVTSAYIELLAPVLCDGDQDILYVERLPGEPGYAETVRNDDEPAKETAVAASQAHSAKRDIIEVCIGIPALGIDQKFTLSLQFPIVLGEGVELERTDEGGCQLLLRIPIARNSEELAQRLLEKKV